MDTNTEDYIEVDEITVSIKDLIVDIFLTEEDIDVGPFINTEEDGENILLNLPFGLDSQNTVVSGEMDFSDNYVDLALNSSQAYRLYMQLQRSLEKVNSPGVNDVSKEDVQYIGEQIRTLSCGDTVAVTNSRLDEYIHGEVIEKTDKPNGEEYYQAILKLENGEKAELHVNWRDIPEDDEDQETPYTGLLISEPFDDTAPPVTDIIVF